VVLVQGYVSEIGFVYELSWRLDESSHGIETRQSQRRQPRRRRELPDICVKVPASQNVGRVWAEIDISPTISMIAHSSD
jgi:hypothetical protein